MPASDTAPALDDETTASLTLFNEYVEADRERTQREKRIKKAERVKDEAAAAVKKLGDGGSAEQKAEAEKAYHDAAERWKILRDGGEPPKAEKDAPADEAPPEEAVAEGAATEEAPADEAPADEAVEEPAAEEPPAAEATEAQ